MVNKIRSVLIGLFKTILWLFAIIIILLFCILLLIKIPFFQNKITTELKDYLQKKTGTEIKLNKIDIILPGSIRITDVMIMDKNRDTLFYSGLLEAKIDLPGLFKKNIHLQKITADSLRMKIDRSENDSLFNFDFLIKAFSDTSSHNTSKGTTNITIDKVSFKNLKVVFDDKYSGLYSSTVLTELDLSMEKMDLDRLIFKVGTLKLNSVNQRVTITKSGPTSASEGPSSPLPVISAGKIIMKNCSLDFKDQTPGELSLQTSVGNLELNRGAVNLNTQEIKALNLKIENGNVDIITDSLITVKEDPPLDTSILFPDWKVDVKNLDLIKTRFSYNVSNKVYAKHFDPDHMNFTDINLISSNALYSSDSIKAEIHHLAAIDHANFGLKHFSTKFRMSNKLISANDLQIKTNRSDFTGNATLNFQSLTTLGDSVQNMRINAELKNTKINSSDIKYFVPQLNNISLFKADENYILSGKVTGIIKDLTGKNIYLATGTKSFVRTNLQIKGLPDISKSYFSIPNIEIQTGRIDIINILGKNLIPAGLQLPNDIFLKGQFEGNSQAFKTAANLRSDFGNVNVNGESDKNEVYGLSLQTDHFDIGKLLNDQKLFGPVTLTATANGKGLKLSGTNAIINSEASEIFLNGYLYHNLKADLNVMNKQIEAKIILNDENAEFAASGLVNLENGNEQYKVKLDLKGADLNKLHLYNKDLRIGFSSNIDLKGKDIRTFNGFARFTNIAIIHDNNEYNFDSISVYSLNQNYKNNLHLNSPFLGLDYKANFPPLDLIREVKRNLNSYFVFDRTLKNQSDTNETNKNFDIEITFTYHPLISDLFIPGLKEFDAGTITGGLNGQRKELSLNLPINKLQYGSYGVNGLHFKVNSDSSKLKYRLTASDLISSQFQLDSVSVEGELQDNKAYTAISSLEKNNFKKLFVHTELSTDEKNYRIRIDTNQIFIMNSPWQVSTDNYVVFGENGFYINNLSFNKSESKITLNSSGKEFHSDLSAIIKNFKLETISEVLKKDTVLFSGTVNGDLVLKKKDRKNGFVTDINIQDLTVKNITIGNVTLKAENTGAERFDLFLNISGYGNDLNTKGYFTIKDTNYNLNFDIKFKSLTAKTIEAFSGGYFTESDGVLSGVLSLDGSLKEPDIAGTIKFNDVFFKPSILNNRLHLKNESLEFDNDKLNFKSFNVYDKSDHLAVVNGYIKLNKLRKPAFDLDITTKDFLLINTTAKNNKQYYGRLIVDGRTKLQGSPSLPVVNSNIKLKQGSNFTFAVPESELTTDRGENIVEFTDTTHSNRIMDREGKKGTTANISSNFEITSTIEIDKKAILKLFLDPSSNDSLVVKGEAALSFVSDRSGKYSLTGTYNLTDGSYLVSLENIVKRQFKIESGSTIIWNGDPLDATVNLNAIYTIRTSPIDLIADQPTDQKTGFGQSYLFLVYLKLRGALMHPDISFEIQLPQSEKGSLGNVINARLAQINQNPSELNKQVFALLVLNRFIQENPFQSETEPLSATARSTVGKFLSAQLNQLSSKYVPGVNLNFNVQSYNEYITGQASGRTQVAVGVSKKLFNERLNVQIGGAVDVEGQRARQTTASDVAGDVLLEYKLTKDGSYRVKGFRHNQYEGVIEGQITETGIGLQYVLEFNKWIELLFKEKNKSLPDNSGINQSNK